MLYILFIVAFVIIEYKIKDYMEENFQIGDKKEILGGKITLQRHRNKGAFLNFMEDKAELVKTISGAFLGLLILLFALALPKKGNKLYKLSLTLLLGGAISNVADRILKGYVVDYFSINYKKLKKVIFNLADIAIILGSLLIFLTTLFTGIGKGGTDKAAE